MSQISKKEKIIASIILALIGLFIIWVTGLLNMWLNGMSHVMGDSDFKHQSSLIEEEQTVELDLSDLSINEGKTLYMNETQHIYVSEVLEQEGYYEVVFRSKGNYGYEGATLVTGIKYQTDEPYSSTLVADAVATLNGQTQELHTSRSTSLIYRDGDEFGYYIPKSGIDVSQNHIVEITVTGLVYNRWFNFDRVY
ncbi:hypothetical protein [Aquisalibacillus elongatus]|uniref:Uncharacterized protein n=1 Tax=Aquisalibacillus elongatus TaxID=485577 RepID=A0A3N5BR98_9BACI|nr:hypothetical protein [Aquisalibacillus elongatus]RPF52238.1 hypothetical protein EDC24_2231 [Aquisalibacillus elongatus]